MTLFALALVALGALAQGGPLTPASGAPGPRPEAAQGGSELAQRLMVELSREPRIIGTPGYDRALDLIEDTLQRAGLKTRRGLRKSGRAIPLRSDVLLFEDGNQISAFAGLRERWDPDALPTMPRPMAYDHNPESAEVRGQVVHLGRGHKEDFDRVAGLGLDLEGAIVVATMELAPAARTTSVREIAGRAAAAGASGVLIAPHLDSATGGAAAALWFVEENTIHKEPLPLPVAPIRGVEAEAIVQRLRIKRVRGEGGKAIPLRLGPGPVEASITVQCPLVLLDEVAEVIVSLPPGSTGPTMVRPVSVTDLCERPLDGTFELTANVLALVHRYDAEALELRRSSGTGYTSQASIEVSFGPFAVSEQPALLVPADLPTSRPPRPDESSLRSTLIPGMYTHFEIQGSELSHELSARVDAAARFVGYGVRLIDFHGAPPTEDAGWSELARRVDEAASVLRRPL